MKKQDLTELAQHLGTALGEIYPVLQKFPPGDRDTTVLTTAALREIQHAWTAQGVAPEAVAFIGALTASFEHIFNH